MQWYQTAIRPNTYLYCAGVFFRCLVTVPSSWSDRTSAWSFTIRNTANSPYCETWAVCNGPPREKLGRYGYGGSFYGKICISLTLKPTYSNNRSRDIFYLGLWTWYIFNSRGECVLYLRAASRRGTQVVDPRRRRALPLGSLHGGGISLSW